ncbi:hypothetical protein [Aquabacterium sp.]|uniref:hypothetical protein n=1 Tax=Aquabacterium sp. TaxID=1872578 RepID=UPI0035B4F74B
MKPMKLMGVIAPLLLGVAAANWTPLSFWSDMKEGLIAFLGFLAAALVQVMPITANFLQSDKLTVNEAERLTKSLTRQQRYWMGLLWVTIGALVVVIVGSALKSVVIDAKPLFMHRWFINVSWSAIVTFFIAGSVTFVLVKMVGLFEGMLSLHHLRADLVVATAKREAAEKTARAQSEARLVPPPLPEDYGAVISPPHH